MSLSKADLHVHSKYSDRPSEWFLRRIGSPESFADPRDLYHRCRERGMSFVTITDHNSIDGALEIADLPGTFLSAEVTTYFPEDQCKVHCLVIGINPQQFDMIQRLRPNIYELREYLVAQDVIASVAHPLLRVNGRLTIDHLEKLLVLFNRFETVNGAENRRMNELAAAIVGGLTQEMIVDLADRHGIEPAGPDPWVKGFTAGSDDHSGLYVGSSWTVAPEAANVEEFLSHLRAGDHEAAGTSGTSLTLAHAFYHIGYGYYKARLMDGAYGSNSLVGALLSRLLERDRERPRSIGSRVVSLAGRTALYFRKRRLNSLERRIVDELSPVFFGDDGGRSRGPALPDDRRIFQIASRLSQHIGCAFVNNMLDCVRRGRLIETLQSVSALGPVALGIAPYLAAFRTQHKDELFLQAAASHFEASRSCRARSGRKVWVADGLAASGLVSLMKELVKEARDRGRDFSVITCSAQPLPAEGPIKRFEPVDAIGLRGDGPDRLSFPPFLEIIEHIERESFAEIVVTTPGPLGLTALAAGRLLGLKLTAVFDADFPLSVQSLTGDPTIVSLAFRYLMWFYAQMHSVLVANQKQSELLGRSATDTPALRFLPESMDPQRFRPDLCPAADWDAVVDSLWHEWAEEREATVASYRHMSPEGDPDLVTADNT